MKELVELVAKALVDDPDGVEVREVPGDRETVLRLSVSPSDLGKVIGRQGRTAKSIRTILAAAGSRLRKRVVLEIVE
ncbi:MAG TPA: KH domain-containing protein [Candidatus Methylomirabilis sp.]|nr:KH domain-containing protein [Candidatus Methylomirabilis sp.]